jgi:uncharacterized protein
VSDHTSTALEIVKAHYAAGPRGDLAAMMENFADDIAWKEMDGFPYAGTFHGPDEVRAQVFERIGKEWKGFRAVPEQFVDGGDGTVVAIGDYSGTYRATDKSMTARFVHVFTVSGGEIVGFEQITDSHVVRQAMA